MRSRLVDKHVLNAKIEPSMARLALKDVRLAVPTKDVPDYWAKEMRKGTAEGE